MRGDLRGGWTVESTFLEITADILPSLGKLRDPRAVGKLIPLLEDEDRGVADQAWQALYQITGEDRKKP